MGVVVIAGRNVVACIDFLLGSSTCKLSNHAGNRPE